MGLKDNIKKLQEYKNPESQYPLEFGLALLFVQAGETNKYYVEKVGFKLTPVDKIEQLFGVVGYVITKNNMYRVMEI